MLRTPLGVDVPAASGGNYTANLLFDTAGRAKYMRVGDIVEDRFGALFTVLWWATYPGDFTSGGTTALGGTVTPTQSLTTTDAAVYTSGQLDVRPLISIDGSLGTVMDTGPTDGQSYDSEVTATWTSAAQGNAATTGDHLIDSTGKAYAITSINVPGASQWASGVVVSELEKEGIPPQIGSAYLYSPTSNFSFYQGKVLNTIAEDARRNRDEFTTDVVISGIQNDLTNIAGDVTDLATELGLVIASGGPDGSGVGPHNLLSSTHTDTIAQVAVSGGLVAALDGAWSQLSPGIEGGLLSVENGLPAYTDNITVTPGGDINIGGNVVNSGDLTVGGNTVVSGDLTVTGEFNGTPDLTASGFIGVHELLSGEHTDTIAQVAVSGGIVAALDGAWSQLPPGMDGNIIFVEGGLPAYNSNVTLFPDGSIDIGGNVLISGDLNVLGNLDGTPDLTASGFVVGPASATDSSLALYDGVTGELIKELLTGGDGLVLTASGGAPAWLPPATGAGGGGGISGPGSSTDNAVVRWNGVTATLTQDSLVIVDDSGIMSLPAGLSHNVTQASGDTTVNVQNNDWLVRVDTQGQAVTVNMPLTPVDGQIHTIKDGNGNAQNNNITVTAAAGQLIDPSAPTLVMNLAYQSVELLWVADPGVWHII